MTDRPKTPILDRVSLPSDLKTLTDAQLRQLAAALRSGVGEAEGARTTRLLEAVLKERAGQ